MQRQSNDGFEVLIVAENFSSPVPTANGTPWALQKMGPFSVLELCLEWVSWFDSPNVIVAFTSSIDAKTSAAIERRWNHTHTFDGKLRVISFQNCHSMNDILREVADRHLLTADFILINNPATFCSSNLANQLQAFRARLKKSKNNVLTLLYSPAIEGGGAGGGEKARAVVGVQKSTYKLILYNPEHVAKEDLSAPKELFVDGTLIRSDLVPTGISICAFGLMSHFSGNYDFQSFDDIVHDILHNEEFLAQNIHLEVLADATAVAFGAETYPALLEAQSRLIRRHCFPLTFENALPFFKDFDRPEYRSTEQNIYVSSTADKEVQLFGPGVRDAVFGKGAQPHATATIEASSFGTNVRIGKGSVIRNCIFGDCVKVGENCSIEDCIIGSGTAIGNGIQLKRVCSLETEVKLPSPDCEALKQLPSIDSLCVSLSNRKKAGQRVKSQTKEGAQEDGSSDSEDLDQTLGSSAQVEENVEKIFLAEVVESMQAALDVGKPASQDQIERMKLEINASKLAYNISIDDLAKLIFHAFISLPSTRHSFVELSKLFKEWSALWKHYYKRDSSKTQMLHAVEEFAAEDEQFSRMVPKLIHFLADTEEFLRDSVVLMWYYNLSPQSGLVAPLKKLIDWIEQTSSEEEESGDEGEEDEEE